MPSTTLNAQSQTDIRAQILAFIDQQRQHLAGTRAFRSFQHRHPLHHLQHLPFDKAMQQAEQRYGRNCFLSLQELRSLHAQGRILESDLIRVLEGEPQLDLGRPIAHIDGKSLSQGDIYLASLLHPLPTLRSVELIWAITEDKALEAFQADVPLPFRDRLLAGSDTNSESDAIADLWQASLEVLSLEHQIRHPEEYLDLSPELAEQMLANLDAEEESDEHRLVMDRLVRKSARHDTEQLFEQLGERLSLRGLLQQLTGRDLLEDVVPLLVPYLNNFLDQGQASWRNPPEAKASFYQLWRSQIASSLAALAGELPHWQDQLDRLPQDPMDALTHELRQLGLRQSLWLGYLELLVQELPGWSARMAGRNPHPNHNALVDFLAVRLILDRLLGERLCHQIWRISANLDNLRWYFLHQGAEFLVRHHLFNKRLPEYLAHQAQLLLKRNNQDPSSNAKLWWQLAHRIHSWQLSRAAERPLGRSVLREGWRLFRLCQHLGLSGKRLRGLGEAAALHIIECLEHIDTPYKAWLWQRAYELHYRNLLFNALRQNWSYRKAPAPNPMSPTKTAQLITSMDNRLEGLRRHLEEVNPQIETLGLAPLTAIHGHACSPPSTKTPLKQWRYQAAHNQPLAALALSTLGAPLALLDLGLRFWWPRAHHGLLGGSDSTDVRQAAELDRDIQEQDMLALAEAFLRSLGLTQDFAPLVVILGQTASSQNNAFRATYQGLMLGLDETRARNLALLCNRPEIRTALAKTGISIPETSWFLALSHDSSSQAMVWHDLELLPKALQPAFAQLQKDIKKAQGRQAQESGRRLKGAFQSLDLKASIQQLRVRSLDFNQPEPEFGHAGIAAAIIGRRQLTKGLFLDRRACLISYNPEQDPEGRWLEQLLLDSIQPLIDLSLSHYLARMDGYGWGAGSRVLHSIKGLMDIGSGAEPDLVTGLETQMVAKHEPMRLQLILDTSSQTFSLIRQRQPALSGLINRGWLHTSLFDAAKGMVFTLDTTAPGTAWRPWGGPYEATPRVPSSADWYFGQRTALAPALIGKEV